MSNPEQVITFSANGNHFAVPADAVEHLFFATKLKNFQAQESVTISSYKTYEAEHTVIELLGNAKVGERASVLKLKTAENSPSVAICASQINNLQLAENFQDMPAYESELSPLFNRAFALDGSTFYLLKTESLAKLIPASLSIPQAEPSEKTLVEPSNLPIKLNSNNWLQYGLSIINAKGQSGHLALKAADTSALIDFTAGHPTHASHDGALGLAALKSIAAFNRWVSYSWQTTASPSQAAHNISESVESVFKSLKSVTVT
ncbi:MAG: hypothetical protein ACSHYA_10305 [Opitutaceae bacterium]